MNDDVIEIEIKHIDTRPIPPYVVKFRDGSERTFWEKPSMTAAEWAEAVSMTETRIEAAPDCKFSVGSA
jgi:hypothetical protein